MGFDTKNSTLDLTTFGIKDYADLAKHSLTTTINSRVSTVISNDHGDQITLIGERFNQLTTDHVMSNHDTAAAAAAV